MSNGRVDSYNRRQKQRDADIAKMVKYYAKLKAGKSLRSTHKFAGAEGKRIDGYYFQSSKEAKRYGDLKLMQTANLISALMVHPSADMVVNGVKICKGVFDFSYWDNANKRAVVEDVKKERRGRDGKIKFTTDTDLSKIKQRLMLACHGIEVVLVK